MIRRSWIRRLFDQKPRTIRRHPVRWRPGLEALEDRLTPSTYTVTDASDTAGSANDVTLRYAIDQAIANQDQNAVIGFSSSLAHQTITLSQLDSNNSDGSTAFFISNANIIIDGSGAAGLVISGGNTLRPFTLASSSGLTLENLTLQDGLAKGTGTAAEGGAIFSSGTLTLSGVTVKSNQAVGSAGANATQPGASGGIGASAFGGGVYTSGGAVTLTNDTFSGNKALGGNGGKGGYGLFGSHGGTQGGGGAAGGGSGGGLYMAAAGTLTLTNDTLSGNTAQGGVGGQGGTGGWGSPHDIFAGGNGGVGGVGSGGGIYAAAGTLTLTNDTLSGNNANGGVGGQGGTGFSSNSFPMAPAGNGGNGGAGTGGGLYLVGSSATHLFNALIAQDSVQGGAGGAGGVGKVVVGHKWVNSFPGSPGSAADPDVSGTVASSDHDLIGDGTGSNLTNGTGGDQVGTSANPINPLLGALAGNGGSTQTMALLPGSPAIAAGDSSASNLPSTDERGLPRTLNGTIDIGAYEAQGFTITVTGGNNQPPAHPTDAFALPLVVTVTAADGVDPVAGGEVTFTPPSSGASAALSPSNPVTIAADGMATVNATANSFDGSYDVTVNTAGAASPATISLTDASSLEMGLIAQINVANAAGGGTITLPANTIYDFTLADNSTNGANALPVITTNITIVGNGATVDTIERTGSIAFRLFDVASGGSLTLENLTLEGGLAQGTGSAAEGGAIYSSGPLTLSGVTVKSNRAVGSAGAGASGGAGASAFGGGVYATGGAVTLTNDTFSGNQAQGGNGGNGGNATAGPSGLGGPGGVGGVGGAGSGGGLYSAAGTVTLSTDKFSGNTAVGGVGGQGGNALTFAGVGGVGGAGSGGGMYAAAGTVTLSNDTLSGNNANGGPGGVGGNYNANTKIKIGTGGVGGAGSGGGMYAAAGTVTLSKDNLSGNNANRGNGGNGGIGGNGGAGSGGGMYAAAGTVTLSNDKLSSNNANGGYGGTGFNVGNGGAGSGGGMYAAAGTVTLSNDTLSGNNASGGYGANGRNGGPGGNGGNGGVGGAGSGGAMYAAAGTATLTNDTLKGNNANGGYGGPGGNSGVVGVGGVGGVGLGGAMYAASGTVMLSNDTLSSNDANGGKGGDRGQSGIAPYAAAGVGGVGSGGGLYAAGGTVTLSNDTLSGNDANGGKGGNGGRGVTATNAATGGVGGKGGAGSGGGLYVAAGTATLTGDTLSDNKAGGGGLYVAAAGTATLTNDTLCTNNAQGGAGGTGGSKVARSSFSSIPGGAGGAGGAGLGGGLYVATGTATLINNTLSSNNAKGGNGGNGGPVRTFTFPEGAGGAGGNGSGGGLYLVGGSMTHLVNTLIAQDTVTGGAGGLSFGTGKGADGAAGTASDPDVSGNVQSSDHDLIGDSTGSNLTNGSNGDQVGNSSNPINPLLGPLQNNGGPTETMALLIVNGTPSPAIDAGDSSAPGLPGTDQRGYSRIAGNAVDIGAYEYQATAATTDLSVSGNGPSSVAQGGQITYTLTVTNNSASDQSNVTLTDVLPANTTFVSWKAPSGWSSSAPATGSSSGAVSAWINSLTANSSASFTLVVQVDNLYVPSFTHVSDTASVGPISGDPDPGNNSVTFNSGPLPYILPPSNASQLLYDMAVANYVGGPTTFTLAAGATFDFTAPNDSSNGGNALPVINDNCRRHGGKRLRRRRLRERRRRNADQRYLHRRYGQGRQRRQRRQCVRRQRRRRRRWFGRRHVRSGRHHRHADQRYPERQ
jgi:uncharacterized repeat protein (TIGR01451 family)